MDEQLSGFKPLSKRTSYATNEDLGFALAYVMIPALSMLLTWYFGLWGIGEGYTLGPLFVDNELLGWILVTWWILPIYAISCIWYISRRNRTRIRRPLKIIWAITKIIWWAVWKKMNDGETFLRTIHLPRRQPKAGQGKVTQLDAGDKPGFRNRLEVLVELARVLLGEARRNLRLWWSNPPDAEGVQRGRPGLIDRVAKKFWTYFVPVGDVHPQRKRIVRLLAIFAGVVAIGLFLAPTPLAFVAFFASLGLCLVGFTKALPRWDKVSFAFFSSLGFVLGFHRVRTKEEKKNGGKGKMKFSPWIPYWLIFLGVSLFFIATARPWGLLVPVVLGAVMGGIYLALSYSPKKRGLELGGLDDSLDPRGIPFMLWGKSGTVGRIFVAILYGLPFLPIVAEYATMGKLHTLGFYTHPVFWVLWVLGVVYALVWIRAVWRRYRVYIEGGMLYLDVPISIVTVKPASIALNRIAHTQGEEWRFGLIRRFDPSLQFEVVHGKDKEAVDIPWPRAETLEKVRQAMAKTHK